MRRLGVIVDAYSTGNKLAREFSAYGVECFHVQSRDPILIFDAPSFVPEDFAGNFVYRGDVAKLAEDIGKLSPSFVIAGCESGVPLADALSEVLKLPSNGTPMSSARRDKFLMQAALKDAGVEHIRSLRTALAAEAITWCDRHCAWPCVVKPLDSAGSDGVTFCHSPNELRAAFASLLGRENAMGTVNTLLIVQERLVGEQYIVNTVSLQGSHYVSEVWKDVRLDVPGACAVGYYEELLESASTESTVLGRYAGSVLDALEIQNGPAHLEIMLVEGRGPVLIEVGARMQGSICDSVVLSALNHSHVTLTALCYADPNGFTSYSSTPYQVRKPVLAAMLVSPRNLRVSDSRFPSAIRALPSYAADQGLPMSGTSIKRTIDMETCPGIVYLSHESAEVFQADYVRLRELEVQMYEEAVEEVDV
ncbi:ATP-grasp domain-containing protein [Pseudomonas sp. B11]|uniref:ATP-grasp domain-containing protein n=1 Tax=Pseudomonas sp. MPFS TaxID=2795724 RepID=UPI001F133C99|nr:ATP-grasp domain-containing protein [Pseudomonas sp. MPFS]UMZ09792.1 ATP-grasp domain-containing protein [Pseudomonas sp. MPFS]